MAINKVRLRRLHSTLAPIMALPLLLTLVTGILYQIAITNGQGSEFFWLIELHKGKFGSLNLEKIYPYLNALGLLTLIITGVMMWMQLPRRKRHS